MRRKVRRSEYRSQTTLLLLLCGGYTTLNMLSSATKKRKHLNQEKGQDHLKKNKIKEIKSEDPK